MLLLLSLALGGFGLPLGGETPRGGVKARLLHEQVRAQPGCPRLRQIPALAPLYCEEALAGREAALWLAVESITLEHAGKPLSRYEVRIEADTGELRSVGRPRPFGTSAAVAQPRLFELDALGEAGWLKTLRLEGYAYRRPRGPLALQHALFPYAQAL